MTKPNTRPPSALAQRTLAVIHRDRAETDRAIHERIMRTLDQFAAHIREHSPKQSHTKGG